MDVFSNPSIAYQWTANHLPSSHMQNILTPTLLHLLFFAASVNNPGCFPISWVLMEGGSLVVTSRASQIPFFIDETCAPAHARCNRWSRPKTNPVQKEQSPCLNPSRQAGDFLCETQSCFCVDSLTHPPGSCFRLLNHTPFLITGNHVHTRNTLFPCRLVLEHAGSESLSSPFPIVPALFSPS